MDGFGWIQVPCFVLATASWASAVHRAAGDPLAAAVHVGYYLMLLLTFYCSHAVDPLAAAVHVGYYLMLLLTFYCSHAVDRAPPGRRRRRFEVAGAVLTAILISMTAGKLADACRSIMLPWAAAFVWVMAAGPVAVLLWGAFRRWQAV